MSAVGPSASTTLAAFEAELRLTPSHAPITPDASPEGQQTRRHDTRTTVADEDVCARECLAQCSGFLVWARRGRTAGRIASAALLSFPLICRSRCPCCSHVPHDLPADLSARLPLLSDKRQYRVITLPNSLTALLISDPDTDKAAASLDVNVGSFAEPSEALGLAHFLEHMSVR
jgi:hypothetical protein